MRIEEIRVCGTVQGVGFRPTVYRLAKVCGLKGNVCNDGEGVLIRVYGSEEVITDFVEKLYQECPPLGRIKEVIRSPYLGEFDFDDFVISGSVNSVVKTEISPDAATCFQCQKEILDPFSRYFRYPFTNCTHCGPRLSIIRAIPYDRNNTSMVKFPMCGECEREYQNVENRRFHAQPIACHVCGPRAWLERADGKPIISDMFSMLDDVDAVCTLLQKGEIVAIKGLGGFHLACDATLENAVQKLRNRKQRYHKPFALMARDINIISEYCYINDLEKELLTSPAAPIVLLNIKDNQKLPFSIAPGQNKLGFMLPYTPLHHLILRRMKVPIVLTSGNISDEPQCINNEDAKDKLSKIADYFILHNRDIVNRVDDSVVRVIDNKIQTLRRARGYAPAAIILPPGFENVPLILAMGSELKNTFCLLRSNEAILSQHLGDLENAAAFNAYQETLNLYLNLFAHKPEIIAIDKHPEYLSAKLGQELATANQIPLAQIQHHHAHVAACMAENNIPLDAKPVLGIAFDGLGYGEDGKLWGGEFLLADYGQFQRLATFKSVAMIGSQQAIYQPWRNTYAQLISAYTWEQIKQKYGNLEIIKFLENKNPKLLNQIIEKGINSPLTSSVGRLFDAVAAAIGICREESSYEGQAAIEMEAIADVNILNNDEETLNYTFKFEKSDNIYYIDTSSTWREILNDINQHISSSEIAAKFHKSLAIAVVKMIKQIRQEHEFDQVALTGGVFQNRILLKQVKMQLEKLEINVLTHSIVPANDGGLSLGQAVIAAAKYLKQIT
ncbi:carbamoyltransferase HypF [Anabaena cylindrica FACHB-243]|uniref:Carbamoyltransferase n=1 Tax=Anabaena cylindrica (strain ATCC 27899 / PCC 7122) TaxID=272123 RepID=K9ZG17_ANACC|nr:MULTISPECIES: carbamoyltransferase HypF [Anabaena]AFZ57290.1 (NiFe) hydrogenase maturation protein HypF [Anabaena cylindrica PCC 7122]AZL96682.1 [NiFe] hydrogenase maturation protein HypF [Anabaena sp. CCAP 1446/1C]MBD2420959.1 carbamoyltransferase HypF [Anabaena cylindrica FACHB-243]MBY5283440.1 carbamoyltransferase HypF [Anabaena sp. CCAP 1446/1C]MBY5310886.1 carbamoyltransferase HypF [Anabaena sp. CCAP 1446/1C]